MNRITTDLKRGGVLFFGIRTHFFKMQIIRRYFHGGVKYMIFGAGIRYISLHYVQNYQQRMRFWISLCGMYAFLPLAIIFMFPCSFKLVHLFKPYHHKFSYYFDHQVSHYKFYITKITRQFGIFEPNYEKCRFYYCKHSCLNKSCKILKYFCMWVKND